MKVRSDGEAQGEPMSLLMSLLLSALRWEEG